MAAPEDPDRQCFGWAWSTPGGVGLNWLSVNAVQTRMRSGYSAAVRLDVDRFIHESRPGDVMHVPDTRGFNCLLIRTDE